MQRVYVPLNRKQREALLRYAEKQYRDPRIQALMFVEQGLQQVGALAPQANEEKNQPAGEPTHDR